MKKVICAILGIAMLFSMNMTVFAASMPTEDSQLSTEMQNAVESDITSLSEAGNANLSDRIALRDMNGTLYAYFVPIVESSLNAVSGYSVVSTRGACFSVFPGPDTSRLLWFRWCPGSHPCSWFPVSQSPCKHRPAAWEKPEAPLPGLRSVPILPCTSRCPPGPCTHRHGLRPPPQAGFSASRGT